MFLQEQTDSVSVQDVVEFVNEPRKEIIMSKWMYDPETDKRNGKEFTYNLPIHQNEDLLSGFTYKQIIDETVANYGRKATEAELRKAIKEHVAMAIENMEENIMLCIDNMMKEINND